MHPLLLLWIFVFFISSSPCIRENVLVFLKSAAQMVLGSSAAVRATTCGRVRSAPPTGNVTVMQTAHVAALTASPQTASSVSRVGVLVRSLSVLLDS